MSYAIKLDKPQKVKLHDTNPADTGKGRAPHALTVSVQRSLESPADPGTSIGS